MSEYAYVPEEGVHAFRNDGDVAARFRIPVAPGVARERFFGEPAQIRSSGRTVSDEEWGTSPPGTTSSTSEPAASGPDRRRAAARR